jgi:hypothetical protein
MPRARRRRPGIVLAATAALVASMAVAWPSSAQPQATADRTQNADPVLLFAADGLRQDIVERYAAHSGVPGFADLLKRGGVGHR